MKYVVGIDTGGTFTDVAVTASGGGRSAAKALTTPENLVIGVMAGLEAAAQGLGLSLEIFLDRVEVLRYSGTTATNALLTRSGPPTGMLITAGFEDTLTIGRARSASAGLSEQEVRRVHRHTKPEALVPRSLIRGITERIDARGDVVVALDEPPVAEAARELRAAGAASIAVCFMWSVRNPAHELRASEIIRDATPGVRVHCSHEVAPSVGEYERFLTTAVDAYVSPVLSQFLDDFRGRLEDAGFHGRFLIGKADGGCLDPENARPVSTLHSGPAFGVMAAAIEGGRLGRRNIIATDVGGTSFDVGVVTNGAWHYARDPQLARLHLSEPMIEVASVGAGGGSIVWIDEIGSLHVGPQSAGSYPGPASYGQGGMLPTLTDANLILGYLDQHAFLGGHLELSLDKATRALEPVASELGLDLIETAAGVFRIANSRMGDLLARQVIAKGDDPRDFTVFAYGGAGPMHAAFYAAESGASEVVVPMQAGTFSALGVASAPVMYTLRASAYLVLPVDPVQLTEPIAALEVRARAALQQDGFPEDSWEITRILEMRYGAQVHTVRVPIGSLTAGTATIDDVTAQFDAMYEREYGVGSAYPEAGRLVTGIVVEGRAYVPGDLTRASPDVRWTERAPAGSREAYFGGRMQPTSVYRYEELAAGDILRAPAIIEATNTTVTIPPRVVGRVDEHLNIRMSGLTTQEITATQWETAYES